MTRAVQFFLSALAIVLLALYTIFGAILLQKVGWDMDSPLMFFLMLPTWPFSFFIYGFILYPLLYIEYAAIIIFVVVMLDAMYAVLASGEFEFPAVVVVRRFF